jgi:predicted dehydrogenase
MLRLALIGCREGTCYARLAVRLRGGSFTAVVNGDASTAQRTALALGADVWLDNFDGLLSEHAAKFDAAVIHWAGPFPALLCRRTAEAGKHLLVEGPPGSCDSEVVAACARAGARLMVGQSFRFLPSIQAVKASLDAGQLGEPGLLRIHRWEAPDPHSELMSPVTREIDLACWLFGQRPREVYATARWVSQARFQQPEYVQLHLGFANGGVALIDHAQSLSPGDGYYALSLIGSKGSAYADDHANTQLLFAGGRPQGLLGGQGDSHVLAQLQEFIQAVAENREPLITAADSQRALEVAAAAALSIGRGLSVSWTENGYAVVS